MKCFFRSEVECPVPERYLSGDYCSACAAWENVKANVMMAEATKRMTEASVFTPQGDEHRPDGHQDVA